MIGKIVPQIEGKVFLIIPGNIVGIYLLIRLVPGVLKKQGGKPLYASGIAAFSLCAAFLIYYLLQGKIKRSWLKALIASALGLCVPFSYLLIY